MSEEIKCENCGKILDDEEEVIEFLTNEYWCMECWNLIESGD